ncbi:hypothetical protein [Tabrizicola sp. M-4]|uniref:hypothetical protein n=1 Tax=Tabrizicola sp. M-4 TaxID=3055847 RepID=UPI003DA8FD9D
MPIDPAQKYSVAIRSAAASAVAGCKLNLSDPDRIAIATELYRLADAIAAKPRTQTDAVARQQAIRRVQWLKSWLKRAEAHKPGATDTGAANETGQPTAHADFEL